MWPLQPTILEVASAINTQISRVFDPMRVAASAELSESAAMTPKQEAFVREYLVDLNATQAAIRAGYSKRTAHVIGHENLTKPEIAAAIETAMNERAKRTEITADYVLEGIRDTVERCRAEGEAFNPAQALKGFELLGKHLKLFTDKLEHTGRNDKELIPQRTPEESRNMLSDRLAEAITRYAANVTKPPSVQ